MTSVQPPTQPFSNVPQRPKRRPKPCRAHTLLFWAVMLVFVTCICYLGLLALGDTGHLIRRSQTDLHPNAEIVVAICAIAAVAGAVVSRYHVR
jgi:hypothetical protein